MTTKTKLLSAKLIVLLSIPLILLGLILIYTSLAEQGTQNNDETLLAHVNNMSRTAKNGQQSGMPHLKNSGPNVAMVWDDGFNDNFDTKNEGWIYLLTANETDGYWRFKVPIFTATESTWGVEPDFLFDRNNNALLHVVWAEGVECEQGGTDTGCTNYPNLRYAACDISSDLNTCSSPSLIASAGNTTENYRSPSLTQDEAGSLHIVWSDGSTQAGQGNNILYSRSNITNSTLLWSTPQVITNAEDGAGAQIYYHEGLHLVWEYTDQPQIMHMFDPIITNTVFTSTNENLQDISLQEDLGGYESTDDASRPYMTSFGRDVYVIFDIKRNPETPEFGIMYNTAFFNENQGSYLWRSDPLDVTEHFVGNRNYTRHTSDNPSPFYVGLNPQLLITHTENVTWLHAIWQQQADGSEESIYRLNYSTLNKPADLSDFLNIDNTWSRPPQNLTPAQAEPTAEPTNTPSPERQVRQAPQNDDLSNIASLAPSLTFGQSGDGHLAYMKPLDVEGYNNNVFDIYYQGGIAGTIDPEYIKDEVDLTARAVPSSFVSTQVPFPPIPITYTVQLSNSGNFDAVKVGLTSTLSNKVEAIELSAVTVSDGEAQVLAGGRVITWYGTIPAQTSITITYQTNLANNLSGLQTVFNRVQLWNHGSRLKPLVVDESTTSEVILEANARTIVAQYLNYLPVILK